MKHTYRPPFSSYSDEWGDRTFNTDYQNLTGKLMMVSVSILADSIGATAYCQGWVKQTAPTDVTGLQNQGGIFGGLSGGSIHTIMMIVPAGWYYSLHREQGAGSSVSIESWIEVT